jgi:hypothetical protein
MTDPSYEIIQALRAAIAERDAEIARLRSGRTISSSTEFYLSGIRFPAGKYLVTRLDEPEQPDF